jgi:hypothetical protein
MLANAEDKGEDTTVATSEKPKLKDKEKTATKAIDPKADALLREMGKTLSGMKNFKFDSEQIMEVVTKDGQKIQGLAETSVAVQRPNKLRVDRMGPLGGGSLYYDGKAFTFYGKRDNMYATAPAPDTLDATIDFAREKLSIDAPGADLLYGDPYAILMEDAVSGQYLGAEMVGDRKCHHLAYRANETDWQIWIEEGRSALPCRFVITSKKVTGSPQFTVSMTNWKEEPINADAFTFKAPDGATKIEFVTISDKATKQREARK